MQSINKHCRNLIINWTGLFANLITMFFLSPFVVHTLGKVEYGIWSLLTVLTGYLGVWDIGIRASTGRYIMLYLGKNDHHGIDTTIRTGFTFYSCMVGLMLLTAAGIGWGFPRVFASVPVSYHDVVKILLLVMAANVWVSAVRAILSSVLAAHERFDFIRTVDLCALGMRVVGTIIMLSLGYEIIGLMIAVVVSNLINMLLMWIAAKKVYPRLRIWPFMISTERLRELFSYGIASFMVAISVKIIGQTDLIIVGSAISVEAVTIYSVGATAVYYSAGLISQISSTFFPTIQKAVARQEMDYVRWLAFQQGKVALIVGLLIYIGFMTFSHNFIYLWMVGPEFDREAVTAAAIIMTILASARLPILIEQPFIDILNSIGMVKVKAFIVVLEALTNLGLSLIFVLMLGWGITGVALGTLFARIFVRAFPMIAYACYHAKINIRKLTMQLVLPGVMIGILFAGWALLLQWIIPPVSWGLFFGDIVLSIVGYILFVWGILLSTEDRAKFMIAVKTRMTRDLN